MDDPLLVRLFERLGDLAGDAERLVEGERRLPSSLSARVGPSTSSRTSACAARLLEAVDRGDVGVLQLGEELRLALEARQALRVAR